MMKLSFGALLKTKDHIAYVGWAATVTCSVDHDILWYSMTLSHLVKYPATAAEKPGKWGRRCDSLHRSQVKTLQQHSHMQNETHSFPAVASKWGFLEYKRKGKLLRQHLYGRSSCCMSSSLTRPPFKTLPSAVSSQNQFKHSVGESNRFRGTAANWHFFASYHICHISLLIQNRTDMKWHEQIGWRALKVPSKIKTHARLRCNGGLETQLWSMTSWSSWQSQKAISVSLPRSIQISTILYLSTSYAVSMLHLLKSGKTWVGICFFLKNQRPKQPKHIEFRCPNSKLPGKGLRASRQGHTLLTFCRV